MISRKQFLARISGLLAAVPFLSSSSTPPEPEAVSEAKPVSSERGWDSDQYRRPRHLVEVRNVRLEEVVGLGVGDRVVVWWENDAQPVGEVAGWVHYGTLSRAPQLHICPEELQDDGSESRAPVGQITRLAPARREDAFELDLVDLEIALPGYGRPTTYVLDPVGRDVQRDTHRNSFMERRGQLRR